MGIFRPAIRDDRGVKRPLMPPPIGDWRRQNIEALAQYDDGSGRTPAQIRRLTLVTPLLVASMAAAASIVVSLLYWPNFVCFFLPLIFLGPFLIPLGGGIRAARMASRDIARQYVRAGLCPSCGYRLPDVPPDPDGCRVCPECGGAWRAPPPGRFSGERFVQP